MAPEDSARRYFPQQRTAALPPPCRASCSGRQRQPVTGLQSESAKQTSVHCIALGSQKLVWQSLSCWQVPPIGVAPPLDWHVAKTLLVVWSRRYPQEKPRPVQEAVLRQASRQMPARVSQRLLAQSAGKLQPLPFVPVPPGPQYAV
jgi:hypothetical protein